jgi:cis-3-alkyl-4-acyloxetan-2-one decarboxylase
MSTADDATIPGWLANEYPFTPKAFRTPAGARMSYVDAGPKSDEAVLMLHGNPTWSFYYRNVIRELASTTRCVVPDHIGMGNSEKPANYAYTLETRIQDIEALVASLGLKRVHLIVHDWGGAIGFGFAARHSELIDRIVILNTAAFASSEIPLRIAICKLPLAGPLLVRGANAFAWPATWMAMQRRKLSSIEKRGYLWPYDSWAHRIAVSAFVQDIPLRSSHESWKTLQKVEQGLAHFQNRRSLVIWGGRDFCFNDRFLARWREFLPKARVHRIADAGHYVLEDAGEEAVGMIAQFLKEK